MNITKSNWSYISVLAHEIGHHLDGHTLAATNNEITRIQELEADEFSGYILASMGATLKEAQSAMNACPYLDCEQEMKTDHPCTSKRLNAIKVGYEKFLDNDRTKENVRFSNTGMQYKFIVDSPGAKKAVLGSVIKLRVKISIGDVHDSADGLWDKPDSSVSSTLVVEPNNKPGDLMEGIGMMSEGDVVLFEWPYESMVQGKRPEYVKKGAMYSYLVKVTSIISPEELKQLSNKMDIEDEKVIQDYILKNNIKAERTKSGVYYFVNHKGKGALAFRTNKVSIIQKTEGLDGEKFYTKEMNKYFKKNPITFILGSEFEGNIRDEAVQLMKKGDKFTFIIPRSRSINTLNNILSKILVTEIELVNIEY